MDLKKCASLMLASTVISTALSAAVNAEGLRFGTDPLAIRTGDKYLAETGYYGQAQINLGKITQRSILSLYFSLADRILGASGDNANDYEITFLSGTDPRRLFALNYASFSGLNGRLVVQLTVVCTGNSITPPAQEQLVSNDILEANSSEDFVQTTLPQIIAHALKQGQTNANNIAAHVVDGQLMIRNKQTQETRTIHFYGTVN